MVCNIPFFKAFIVKLNITITNVFSYYISFRFHDVIYSNLNNRNVRIAIGALSVVSNVKPSALFSILIFCLPFNYTSPLNSLISIWSCNRISTHWGREEYTVWYEHMAGRRNNVNMNVQMKLKIHITYIY